MENNFTFSSGLMSASIRTAVASLGRRSRPKPSAHRDLTALPLSPMKNLLIATFLLAQTATGVRAADDGYTPLFNGRDFNAFNIILRNGSTDDIKKVFTIDPDGSLHVFRDLPAGSGVDTDKNGTHGVMTTKKSYSRYSLKFEYKWGRKLVNNSSDFQYDAGVFYHITEVKVFPVGLQYQVRYNHLANRNHSGDFIASGTTIQWYSKDGTSFEWPDKGGLPQPKRKGQHYAHVDAPFHGLDDQWNEGEIIVMGDEYALQKLNGQIVNMATELPASAGPIAIESETGEIYWRNIRIKEFPAPLPIEHFLK
jgi:hypothetical protein